MLLIILLLVNATYVTGTIITVYYYMSKHIVQEASHTRQILLEEMNKQITLSMREAEGIAISISTHSTLLDALTYERGNLLDVIETRREISTMINHFVHTRPIFNSVRIYTDKLTSRSSTNRSGAQEPLAPLSDFEWNHLNDAAWIPAHYDTYGYSTVEVVSYVQKLENYHGAFAGWLKVNMKTSDITSLMEHENMNGSMLLMNENEQIVMSFFNSLGVEEVGEPFPDDETGGGYINTKIYGKDHLVVFSSPNHANWRMVEIVPYDVLFQNLNAIRNILLMIGLAGVLFSFVFAYYLSKKVTGVLSDLLIRFKKVEMGSFETQNHEYAIVEIRQIFAGLNKMTVRLRMLLERLNREQKQKINAELGARIAQINPHFLYNTLDMISWTAIRQGASTTSEMIGKLSRLFRIGLSKGELFITVGEELEHATLYFELLQARQGRSVTMEIRVHPRHKLYYIPKLILQPFIENAIIHGFNPNKYTEENPLHIKIDSSVEDGTLYLHIENNGEPLIREPMEPSNKHNGYGFINVQERIQLYFDSSYGVSLYNLPQGVAVTMRLPVIESQEQLDQYTERYN